jgi:hypothetical protein
MSWIVGRTIRYRSNDRRIRDGFRGRTVACVRSNVTWLAIYDHNVLTYRHAP